MGALNECMDGWMDGWTDGWMGGWMDRLEKERVGSPLKSYFHIPVFSLTETFWAVVPVSPVSPVQWGP